MQPPGRERAVPDPPDPQVPTSVCQMRYAVAGSGQPSGEWCLLAASRHSRTATAHSCGTSVRASSRARTSSERFVSCVDRAVIVAGHDDWRVDA